MDAYLTPLALQKIPNTLGNLLGNAYFKQDIRFAPKVRCYVFENEHKQPVAALWSQLDKVDYGLQQSPNATFKFNGTLKTIYDLMENERTPVEQQGTVTIPISPFPIFIVGKAGSLDKFCAAIQSGQLVNSTALPITINGAPLTTTQFQVTCNNHLTKQFNGKLTIGNVSKQLVIKSAASEKMVTKLLTPVKFDEISSFKIPVELIFGNQQKIEETINFEAFAIHQLNGVLDWSKLPAVSLKNRKIVKFTGSTSRTAVTHSKKVGIKGDFDATFKAAWDNEFFYLQVTVIDDKLFTLPKDKHVGGGWKYDSLQLYFDTFCDARTRKVKGYDSNDYNYDIVPNSSNQAIVYRRLAPEQQIAGGLDAPRPNMIEPNVKCSFRKTVTGYVYELTFPKRLLAPMLFRQNAKIGFGIYLNDNDGKGLRSALTVTPPGTGCYMNPQQYPVMLLTK
jgi:cellulose/xylan binding protein with CBM9 domain